MTERYCWDRRWRVEIDTAAILVRVCTARSGSSKDAWMKNNDKDFADAKGGAVSSLRNCLKDTCKRLHYALAVVGCLWYLLGTKGIFATTAFLFLPRTTTLTSVPALCIPSLM
jgi:hypothetical protein